MYTDTILEADDVLTELRSYHLTAIAKGTHFRVAFCSCVERLARAQAIRGSRTQLDRIRQMVETDARQLNANCAFSIRQLVALINASRDGTITGRISG